MSKLASWAGVARKAYGPLVDPRRPAPPRKPCRTFRLVILDHQWDEANHVAEYVTGGISTGGVYVRPDRETNRGVLVEVRDSAEASAFFKRVVHGMIAGDIDYEYVESISEVPWAPEPPSRGLIDFLPSLARVS